MGNDHWARPAVRSAVKSIEEFTDLAAQLAAGVEDGTIVLTEKEKRRLQLTLQMFEVQAGRLRLGLPCHDEEAPAHKRAPA